MRKKSFRRGDEQSTGGKTDSARARGEKDKKSKREVFD